MGNPSTGPSAQTFPRHAPPEPCPAPTALPVHWGGEAAGGGKALGGQLHCDALQGEGGVSWGHGCHDPQLRGAPLTVGKQRVGRAGGGLAGSPAEELRWAGTGESRKPEELR